MMLVNEQPDQHSANARKQQALFEDMPPNCFGVEGRCSAHQAHRCVSVCQRVCIGDLYAIHFTCSSTDHQSKLQLAFKQILQSELVYVRGSPDPVHTDSHRKFASSTILRRAAYIVGDSSGDSSIFY